MSVNGDVMVRRFSRQIKTGLALACSLALLVFLYRKVDLAQWRLALQHASWPFFFVALAVGGLLSALSGWRYSYFSRSLGIRPSPPYRSALKSYFIASSFNLLLPSKLGDLGKGALCARLDHRAYPLELHLFTLYEKVSDLYALLFLGVAFSLVSRWIGGADRLPALEQGGVFAGLRWVLIVAVVVLTLVLLPHRRGGYLERALKPLPLKFREAAMFAGRFSGGNFVMFQGVSLVLWLLHLLQMLLFAQCLGMALWSASGVLALIAAVVIGLLPISFAGIGPRDGALVALLAPVYGPVQPLLLGILLTSRYVLPALVGLPLISQLAAVTPPGESRLHSRGD